MMPIHFEQSNKVYKKPMEMSDEQCSDLSVWEGKDAAGTPIIISHWMPNKEDIESINSGSGIFLCVVSANGMPPVDLSTENPFTLTP